VVCPYLWRKRRKDVSFSYRRLGPYKFLTVCFNSEVLTSLLPWKLTPFDLMMGKIDSTGVWELQVSVFSEINLKHRCGSPALQEATAYWPLGRGG